MNNQGNSVLHMLARQTGRKYEDLYAEHHGTMRFWGDAELTAKQIARIQRIRAERKEKLRKMNACSWCCNKTPEDQLIATVDGKYMCLPCIDDYNEDHTDTSYDECDGCGKGYLCQYGQGLQPFADQFCPSCEPDVDARDSPNVFPYKKCAFCHERSSCGNYTDDDQWQCESCAPEDNRECCEMCGYKTSRDEWTDYLGNDILYCDDCYEAHSIRIERKCTKCRFRQSFPNANSCNICDPPCEPDSDDEEEPTNSWLLFYKGTALGFPYERQTKLIALWESTITTGLRSGISIEQQKKEIKEDLDEMEKWISAIMGEGGYTNADVERKLGEKDYTLLLNKWGLNVVCGLKLKVIVNDDKNGHLFMCVKSSSAV